MAEGTAAGEYASQLLKAGDAAQPKGCSARFVPVIRKTHNYWNFTLSHFCYENALDGLVDGLVYETHV